MARRPGAGAPRWYSLQCSTSPITIHNKHKRPRTPTTRKVDCLAVQAHRWQQFQQFPWTELTSYPTATRHVPFHEAAQKAQQQKKQHNLQLINVIIIYSAKTTTNTNHSRNLVERRRTTRPMTPGRMRRLSLKRRRRSTTTKIISYFHHFHV